MTVARTTRHLVLELDPAILAVAHDELGFTPDEHIKVLIGDARPALAGLDTDSFDLVVGDAFGSLSVPWHLTTVEFLRDVDRVLRPDGRYLMNLIDGGEQRFAKAEVATLRTVFAHVAVIIDDSTKGNSNIGLVASQLPIDTLALGQLIGVGGSGLRVLGTPDELARFSAGEPVLTDDYAPVDQLINR